MDIAESSSVKDMELRSLSREVAALRSAAAGRSVGLGSAREAMAAAVAAAAEAVEAVGPDRGGNSAETEDERACSGKGEEGNAQGSGNATGVNERNDEKERTGAEDDEGDGGYEEQEASFLFSEDEEEDEQEDNEDDDEEWLPGGECVHDINSGIVG